MMLCRKCRDAKREQWNGVSEDRKEEVRSQNRIRNNNRKEKLRQQGLCIRCCVEKVEEGKISCSSCLEHEKNKQRQRHKDGLCCGCTNVAMPDSHYCRECLDVIKQRNRDRKWDAVIYKGGKCLDCNLVGTRNNAVVFDFHHQNKNEKEFRVCAMLRGKSLSNKTIQELDKCVLLCANCHRMHHFEDE